MRSSTKFLFKIKKRLEFRKFSMPISLQWVSSWYRSNRRLHFVQPYSRRIISSNRDSDNTRNNTGKESVASRVTAYARQALRKRVAVERRRSWRGGVWKWRRAGEVRWGEVRMTTCPRRGIGRARDLSTRFHGARPTLSLRHTASHGYARRIPADTAGRKRGGSPRPAGTQWTPRSPAVSLRLFRRRPSMLIGFPFLKWVRAPDHILLIYRY